MRPRPPHGFVARVGRYWQRRTEGDDIEIEGPWVDSRRKAARLKRGHVLFLNMAQPELAEGPRPIIEDVLFPARGPVRFRSCAAARYLATNPASFGGWRGVRGFPRPAGFRAVPGLTGCPPWWSRADRFRDPAGAPAGPGDDRGPSGSVGHSIGRRVPRARAPAACLRRGRDGTVRRGFDSRHWPLLRIACRCTSTEPSTGATEAWIGTPQCLVQNDADVAKWQTQRT